MDSALPEGEVKADFSSQGPKVQASRWTYCGGRTAAFTGTEPPKSRQDTFILHVPARVEGR